MFALSLLLVVCIIVITVFLRYVLLRKEYSELLPCKKQSFYNVLGDFTHFIRSKNVHLSVMDLLTTRAKQFQKQHLMCLWCSYIPVVFLLKADAVKEVLKSNKLLNKAWMYEWLQPLVGTSLLTSNGEKWKSRKKLLTPCFHADVVRSFISTFNEESQNLVGVLQKESKKDFSEIGKIITLSTVDIACETICGVTIGALENENVQYLKSLRRIASLFMLRIYSPWLWPDIIFWNTKFGNEYKSNVKIMQQVTRDIIQEKRERYLKGQNITLKGKRKAMLDLLLEKQLVSQEMNEEDIREEVDLFIVAGHETIGTTTTWALFLLGHHPEIQAKVHEELDRVFGDDLDRHATEDDLQQLEYLEQVLKETYRLYPGIPIFARDMPEDTTISGYTIPKGTATVVFVYSLHRDEDVFPDPEKFDPDRFSPENIVNIPEFAYIPFSAGQRNCIGYKFAEVELRIILSWILRNFTVESLDPKDKVLPILNIGLHSSVPVRIKIRPRHVHKSKRNQ